jgi:hypothetical protein
LGREDGTVLAVGAVLEVGAVLGVGVGLADGPGVAVGLGVMLVHPITSNAAAKLTARRLLKVGQWWHSPRMPARCTP